MSLRDKFLNQAKRTYKTIEVEGIGSVTLQSITERDRSECVDASDGKEQLAARLVIRSVVDEHNERVFSDDDLTLIQDMPAQLIVSIYREVWEFVEPNEPIEETVKNSHEMAVDAVPST